jgi:hypothetical protein
MILFVSVYLCFVSVHGWGSMHEFSTIYAGVPCVQIVISVYVLIDPRGPVVQNGLLCFFIAVKNILFTKIVQVIKTPFGHRL